VDAGSSSRADEWRQESGFLAEALETVKQSWTGELAASPSDLRLRVGQYEDLLRNVALSGGYGNLVLADCLRRLSLTLLTDYLLTYPTEHEAVTSILAMDRVRLLDSPAVRNLLGDELKFQPPAGQSRLSEKREDLDLAFRKDGSTYRKEIGRMLLSRPTISHLTTRPDVSGLLLRLIEDEAEERVILAGFAEFLKRVWLSSWTNRHECAKNRLPDFDLMMAGGLMPKMVIEVPEEFTEVGKAMAEHLAALERTVSRLGGGKAVDYAEIEAAMSESAGRTELAGHRAILQSLDVDVPAVMIGGVRYTRVGRCEAPYHTMVGSVSVERSLYRQSGERGGQPGGRVVDPVSLRAGVVEDGWLPRAARAMAHAVQQGPSREAEASAREFGRLPYSRASFERVAHLVGALAVADHQDIEDALIDAVEVPEEARSISVSLDRVSVPMEEPRRRPAGRPKKGAPKKPVERNFRMAYCGTVTLHDENGVGRHTIRYGCMPDGDVIGLRDRLVADAATLRSKRPDLKLELLCDGAPEMWNLLEEGFIPKFGNDLYRLVDLHHLMEKLGAAAGVIDDATAADERLRRWKMSLLNRSSAATGILEELSASGMDEGVGTEHPVHAAITYIQSHSADADRMNYARARRLGLALGTGNVEATCKSLFETRMKRCGARWKEETGQHIVQLRALALSDRWGPAIELTLRPLRKAVRAA
jgi:hypothetical protein